MVLKFNKAIFSLRCSKGNEYTAIWSPAPKEDLPFNVVLYKSGKYLLTLNTRSSPAKSNAARLLSEYAK